ncbi:MAG: two-component system LytT family response regulator [Saprospiraceae bacterium]|jgi:two-component system LytT family response regulator
MLKQNIRSKITKVFKLNLIDNQIENANILNTVKRRLLINVAEGSRVIDFDDILRCESMSNYTNIILKSGKPVIVSKTLKQIENALPSSLFLRCHNSHLINRNEVILITKGQIQLTNLDIIPISRQKIKEVTNILKRMAVSIL